MGTSQSSGGPASGVPLVPPWTPDPPGDGDDAGDLGPDADGATESTPASPSPIAPAARFGGARRGLGDFARSGDTGALRRGLGRYVSKGYGGADTASRRFGGTAVTAGALSRTLARAAAGQPSGTENPLDPNILAGRSANEVMDAVVNAVRPIDGTQDAEASRTAIQDALSELLTRYPDADLLDLDAEQRAFAVERYTAADVFRRIQLDLGKTIMDKAPSAAMALSRLKQVREYVREVVSASFRRLRERGRSVTANRVGAVVRDALQTTFTVFEGYVE